MNRISPRDEKDRFRGTLRHYHRAGSQTKPGWDEWVDGKPKKSGGGLRWLKIVFIIMAFLALGGILVGLFIELR